MPDYSRQNKILWRLSFLLLLIVIIVTLTVRRMNKAQADIQTSIKALNVVKNEVAESTRELGIAESKLRYFQAVSEFDKGNFAKVIDLLGNQVERNKILFSDGSSYAYGLFMLGISYSRKDKGLPDRPMALAEAEKLLTSYLEQEKFNDYKDVAAENLAMVLAEQKKFSRALEIINSYKPKEPRVRTYRVLGFIYLRMGKNDEAERYFQKAIEVNSTDFWSALNLYTALARQNKNGEALSAKKVAKMRYKNSGKIDLDFEKALEDK